MTPPHGPRSVTPAAAHVRSAGSRPGARRAWALLALLLALVTLRPAAAHAQVIKPWVPPSADSLVFWASEAKVRFKENRGDTVGGTNFQAYELVGLMGRRMLRSLGRANLLQAHAVGAVIDSLGLDVDVQVDPHFPQFVLMVVRNPYQLTAYAVGFIYWFREDDFRMQGAMLYGGSRPSMRVWWTGYQDQPYSMGVIDHDRSVEGRVRMTLFRLAPAAYAWDILQFPYEGGELAGSGEAAWVDINGDERPELVAWMRAKNDTLFDACKSCPFIIHEQTFTESRDGLQLHDMRVLPSPYATFTLFVRLLGDGNRAAAARLLRDPAKVTEAVADAWGDRRRAKAWVLEYGEEERWPRWLEFLHHGVKGDQRYVVHFELEEGRWVISNWVIPHRAGQPPPAPVRDSMFSAPKRAGTPARRPATHKPAAPSKPATPKGKP
jgi:hypothetical protein